MTLKYWLSTSRALGIAAALGLLVCALALQDIAHGEADVTNEWSAVRVGFILIALSIAVNLTTLGKVQRAARQTRVGAGLS
jgi:hypothetical protein